MGQKQTEEESLKNVDLVFKLVQKIGSRKEQVKKMLEGPIGTNYFTAPASSREEYHNCFAGGLAAHSLNVVSNLKKIATALAPGEFPDATLIFVGLFHDFGKVGDGVEPMYEPHPSEWHRKQGNLYQINKKCQFAPTSERGLFILQQQGIELSFEEWAAIRLNDGQYDDTNKAYKMREPKLAILLHYADRWSAEQEKI